MTVASETRVAPDDDAAQDDEPLLWQRARDLGDADARRRLIDRHLPYARVIAAMLYAQRHHDEVGFDDYLQFARLGLLEAFERFDPARGVRFRSFAGWRMRGAVLDGLGRLTERQSQIDERRRIVRERMESLTSGAGRPAGGDDLFRMLAEVGMGVAIGCMLEGTGLFRDDAAHDGADTVYAAVELQRLRDRLRSSIDMLPTTERQVIGLHYLHGVPFEAIAARLELTRGRVAQIHHCGLARLRSWIPAASIPDRWL